MKQHTFLLLIGAFLLQGLVLAQKTALVCGAGGFIGGHLAKRLKQEGYWVRGVDIKRPEFCATACDEFLIGDLRNPETCNSVVVLPNDKESFDEVYQLAADMGGMGFLSNHDAEIMYNSALINLNMVEACRIAKVKKVFYSSSACVYPEYNQLDPQNPKCSENSAYPAAPDTEYGWEKLFSERLYRSYAKDYGMNVRIARFHNVFGPEGTWIGGREKAPAALCRKVAEAQDGDIVPVWGKGDQTRSFLYIDECVEGIRRLMNSDIETVLNIGSEEMISINDLTHLIAKISGKNICVENVKGPEGVRGRNSDNALIRSKLGWSPTAQLEDGLRKTYPWIAQQVELRKMNQNDTQSFELGDKAFNAQELVANSERSDGFGAQFQTIIAAAIYAELAHKKFVYKPFKKMEHNYNNDPDFLAKKEWLINFIGNFEIADNNVPSASVNVIHFFEANLDACVQSLTLKKIKKIFKANKTVPHYFNDGNLNVAIHVRRPNSHDSRLEGADTPDAVFLDIIKKLRVKYASERPLFHIYSQGNVENFKAFAQPDVMLHLNGSVEDAFIGMVLADVLVTGASSLSYVAGILSEGTVYYIPFWHRPLPQWIALDALLKGN